MDKVLCNGGHANTVFFAHKLIAPSILDVQAEAIFDFCIGADSMYSTCAVKLCASLSTMPFFYP